jgi:hypothetical protein
MSPVYVRVPEKLTLEQSQTVFVGVLKKLGCGGFRLAFRS